MFNFEKMFSLKSDRTSPLPNPIDDSIEKTEKFWNGVNSGAGEDAETIEINIQESTDSSHDTKPKKAA